MCRRSLRAEISSTPLFSIEALLTRGLFVYALLGMAVEYKISNITPRPVAVTPAEAVKYSAPTHTKMLAKNAIQAYLERFFSERGDLREIVANLFPEGTKYITDKSFNFEEDPTKVSLKLSKFYEELQASVPCIVIADTGMSGKRQGLGYHKSMQLDSNGDTLRQFHIIREIQITISVATFDQDTTNSFLDILSLAFGDMNGVLSGSYLHPEDPIQSWELRFPMNIELGTTEKMNRQDDPKNQVWMSIMTIPVTFEYLFCMRVPRPVNPKVFAAPPAPATFFVDFPDTVRVGRKVHGFVAGMPVGATLVSSDPSRALVTRGTMPTEYVLTIRAPGEFKLRLLGDHQIQGAPGEGMTYPALLEKTITASY